MLKTTFLFLLGLKSHSHARDALDVLSKFPPQVPSNFAKSFRDTFFFLVISIFLILEFLGWLFGRVFPFFCKVVPPCYACQRKIFPPSAPRISKFVCCFAVDQICKILLLLSVGGSRLKSENPLHSTRLANNVYDEIRGRTAGPRQGP